ncbi:high-potential iron-sulfur protein [Pseudoflavitalea sp. X16]|uniref:high-potential iron-sulfur protein n=1 Tax=Paraflavitalea devenefica TaxID=2716334 RepID=UPI001420E8E9|nr:high-potential iron-sulfur protein [Paraflavitalea devenefica]NII28458.1 high-potential iron-sulfur protein [Paraflavitalea devenefica]
MNTRRQFIKSTLGIGSLALGSALLLSRCKSKKKTSSASCNDVSGVSKEEQEKRKKLGYVAVTPVADSKCSTCKLYLPPAQTGDCGHCALFKGPVEAGGYCTYFAPLSEE